MPRLVIGLVATIAIDGDGQPVRHPVGGGGRAEHRFDLRPEFRHADRLDHRRARLAGGARLARRAAGTLAWPWRVHTRLPAGATIASGTGRAAARFDCHRRWYARGGEFDLDHAGLAASAAITGCAAGTAH